MRAGARVAKFLRREREVLLLFFASRLLLWVLGWLAIQWLRHGEFAVLPGRQLWDLLFRWDSLWFGQIVARGYTFSLETQSSVGFFPLLPLSIRGLQLVTGLQTPFAGFLISNAALLAATILLRRLVALDFPAPSRIAERSVTLFLFCPMTFFHSAVYTESLFLLISIAALLFARQRQWAGAGIAGAVLTATRANSLIFAVPLLWEAFVVQRSGPDGPAAPGGFLRSRWWLLIMPSGLLAYATYLHVHFGDAVAFAHAQVAFHRAVAAPWGSIIIAAGYPVGYREFFVVTAIIAILLCVLCWHARLRVSYQLYAVAMVLLCLCTTILESFPRYVSVVFPFYLALAVTTLRSETLYALTIAASTGLMTICLALYVCGYFMT